MQNYSALVHPELAEIPPKEVKVFPDVDVPCVQDCPSSSSECTFQAWQSLKSYLSTPVLFQLPVLKATEILPNDNCGVEEQRDFFVLPSSPEQTEPNHVKLRPGDLLTGLKSAVYLETALDRSGETQSDSTDATQSASANQFWPVETKTDTKDPVLSRMIKTVHKSKNNQTPSTSDLHHPTELIVSFTSAEQAVPDESVINDKHDFQLSHFSSDKVKAMDDQTVAPKKGSEDHGLKVLTTEQSSVLKGPSKTQKHGSKNSDDTSCLQVNVDKWTNEKESCSSSRTVLNKLRNTHSRKVQKNTLKKLLRNKEIRYFYACQKEKRSNLGQKTFGTSMSLLHQQKKMERWDLKPVVSECGRILVPHGHSGDFARTKALNEEVGSTKAEAGPQRKLLEVPISPHETSEPHLKPIMAQEAATTGIEVTMPKDEGYHFEKAVIDQVNLQHNVLRETGDENDPLTLNSESNERCSKNDSAFEKTFQENCSPSPEKFVTKNDVLLNKLKSVLLRGKRKMTTPAVEDTAVNIQDTESCLKKSKVDPLSEVMENVDKVSRVQQPSANTKEVPMRSVDPHFASALGLTPKQFLGEMRKNEDVETQQRNEPSDKQVQTDSDKDQVTQDSHPINPRRGRIKALKKHQSISTEHVKKNCKLFFLLYFLKIFQCVHSLCMANVLKMYS